MDDYESKKFIAKSENITVGELLDIDVYKRQGLDIPSLICATFFPASTTQPAMVCVKVAIVSKNTTQSEINIFDRITVSYTQLLNQMDDTLCGLDFKV